MSDPSRPASREQSVALSDEQVRAMAIQAHELYLGTFGHQLPEGDSSNVEFGRLQPDVQGQNFQQVRWMASRLAEHGYVLRPAGEAAPSRRVLRIPDDLATSLARREHDRWLRNKLANGYSHGPDKDPIARTHPFLLAWDDLPDPAPGELDVREKDRNPIIRFPDIALAAGLWVLRPQS